MKTHQLLTALAIGVTGVTVHGAQATPACAYDYEVNNLTVRAGVARPTYRLGDTVQVTVRVTRDVPGMGEVPTEGADVALTVRFGGARRYAYGTTDAAGVAGLAMGLDLALPVGAARATFVADHVITDHDSCLPSSSEHGETSYEQFFQTRR